MIETDLLLIIEAKFQDKTKDQALLSHQRWPLGFPIEKKKKIIKSENKEKPWKKKEGGRRKEGRRRKQGQPSHSQPP